MAMATVFAVPNLIFCMFPLIIKAEGNAYLKVDYLSIFVYFLLGCVYIAVGMFVSSLTESQIIAAVGSFGALLILFLWDSLVGFLPSGAFACMIGMIAFASLLVYVVHQMMKNWIVTGILEGVVVIAAFAVYFVKSSVQSFAGCKRIVCISFHDCHIYFPDNSEHSEETVELGGEDCEENKRDVYNSP